MGPLFLVTRVLGTQIDHEMHSFGEPKKWHKHAHPKYGKEHMKDYIFPQSCCGWA
jgi:hypothetical protein